MASVARSADKPLPAVTVAVCAPGFARDAGATALGGGSDRAWKERQVLASLGSVERAQPKAKIETIATYHTCI